jgi:hypothetical protein
MIETEIEFYWTTMDATTKERLPYTQCPNCKAFKMSTIASWDTKRISGTRVEHLTPMDKPYRLCLACRLKLPATEDALHEAEKFFVEKDIQY